MIGTMLILASLVAYDTAIGDAGVGELTRPATVDETTPAVTKFEISALYYPGTEHRAEWDMVEQVYPNWKPLLGWYDESDPVDWMRFE